MFIKTKNKVNVLIKVKAYNCTRVLFFNVKTLKHAYKLTEKYIQIPKFARKLTIKEKFIQNKWYLQFYYIVLQGLIVEYQNHFLYFKPTAKQSLEYIKNTMFNYYRKQIGLPKKNYTFVIPTYIVCPKSHLREIKLKLFPIGFLLHYEPSKNMLLKWSYHSLKIHNLTKIKDVKFHVMCHLPNRFFRISWYKQFPDDAKTFQEYGYEKGSVCVLKSKQYKDIGTFIEVNHQILTNTMTCQKTFHNGLEFFTFHPNASLLSQQSLLKIQQLLKDNNHTQGDYQLELMEHDFKNIVGSKCMKKIETIFPHKFKQFILRQTQTNNQGINFHKDYTPWTMQIIVSNDHVGGNLVYLLPNGELFCPKRIIGSYTIHNNQIVHGVTPLFGKRISLFILGY